MMETYYIEMDFRVSGPADELEDHLDQVLEHLHELDGVVDPDYTATLSTGEVTFTMVRSGDDSPKVLHKALCDVRTAIHACDGETPGWDEMFREVGQSIRSGEGRALLDA